MQKVSVAAVSAETSLSLFLSSSINEIVLYCIIGYHNKAYLISHSALVEQFSGVVHEPRQNVIRESQREKSRWFRSIHSFIADIYIAPLQMGLLRSASNATE